MHSAIWLFSLLYHYNERIRSFRTINFMDDTFTANRRRLKVFFRYVHNVGWKKSWACKSRADTLSEETIKLLSMSGCRSIHIGVESGDQGVLDSIEKNMNLDKCLESIRLLRKYNVRVECSFIIGLPTDTPETIDKTLILASEINRTKIGMSYIGFATPFPGTKMYNNAKSEGLRIRTNKWRNYTTMKPIFSTERFSIQDVRRAYYVFNHDKDQLIGKKIVSDTDLSDYRRYIEQWSQSVK